MFINMISRPPHHTKRMKVAYPFFFFFFLNNLCLGTRWNSNTLISQVLFTVFKETLL